MDWNQHCSLFIGVFVAVLLATGAGHFCGWLAWQRGRKDGQASSRWFLDPTYLFRSSLYRTPNHPARWAAITFFAIAVVLLIALVIPMIMALQGGAEHVCGFYF
jgi:hypothetical protein